MEMKLFITSNDVYSCLLERIAYTYITTEYPRQLDPVMFRENFVPKIKEVLYKHGNDGFFIQSVGAKVIRGHWVKPSSLITTVRFNTRQDALNFFLDRKHTLNIFYPAFCQ